MLKGTLYLIDYVEPGVGSFSLSPLDIRSLQSDYFHGRLGHDVGGSFRPSYIGGKLFPRYLEPSPLESSPWGLTHNILGSRVIVFF